MLQIRTKLRKDDSQLSRPCVSGSASGRTSRRREFFEFRRDCFPAVCALDRGDNVARFRAALAKGPMPETPVRAPSVAAITGCVLAACCEGFDLQAAGVAAAGIAAEFSPSASQLGT